MTNPLLPAGDPVLNPPAPTGTIIRTVVAKLSAFKVLVLREPILWLGIFSAFLTFVSAQIFTLTVDEQGTLNAVAVAIVGALGAFSVSTDQGVPALVGLAKALIALALAFGLHWAPESQASAIAFLSIVASFWTRTQVSSAVPLATLKTLPDPGKAV